MFLTAPEVNVLKKKTYIQKIKACSLFYQASGYRLSNQITKIITKIN